MAARSYCSSRTVPILIRPPGSASQTTKTAALFLQTVLLPDEFSLLRQFNSQAVKLHNRRELILLALSTLQSYLPEATLFYSLDASEAGQNIVQL